MTRNPVIEQPEHSGEQRRTYCVERKFALTRTSVEMLRTLVRAHS